jgi:hypothetical protein
MRAALVGLVAVALCGACGGPDEVPLCEVRTSVIDHHAWQQVAVESDPFAAEGERCAPDSNMRAEDLGGELSYTIETRGCRWGTVWQAAPFALSEGETLNVRLWYFSQTSFDVAAANLVVAVGDLPMWSRQVPLPASEGGLAVDSVLAPRDVAAGEPLLFHVENHGVNSWNLIEVTVSRMQPCPRDGGM